MYHNRLRHFAQKISLIHEIEPVEEQIYEFRAFDYQTAEELNEGQDEVLRQDEDDLMDSDEEYRKPSTVTAPLSDAYARYVY